MAGSIAPWVFQQFGDNNLNPASGYQLFTYAAGTSTKQATYVDVDLTTPNSNPIILNAAGVCSMFLVPGVLYDFVLADPSDTDPPTSPVRVQYNVAGIPQSGASPDVTGLLGDSVILGDAVYLSDGTGGRVAGTWYKTDAATPAYSTLPSSIGMATGVIAAGASGTIRLLGQVSGLSSLAAGTVYYLDSTAGGITSSPPANARAIGVADSTTSIILSQWVTVPVASATVPGVVSTGTQTFAGAKTFNGAVTSGGAITSTSATGGVGYATGAGGAVTQGTSKSTGVTLDKVCGQITMNNASLSNATAVSFTLTNATIAATDVVAVSIKGTATAGAYRVTVDTVGAGSCQISLRNDSGSPLGEAVVLNFVVLKGVAA